MNNDTTTTDEDLTYNPPPMSDESRLLYTTEQELSDEEKSAMEKYMSEPNTTDSWVLKLVKGILDSPAKSKWYRDHVLFPTIEQKYFPEREDVNPNEFKIEVPIISFTF